jgi:probable blue pigment (indigoidine) exporter
MAGGTVLTGYWGRPEGVGPLAFTSWQLTAGGVVLLPLALLTEGAPPALDGSAIGGYLYLGALGTAAAYALWFRGLARVPATSVAFLGLLSPLSAAVIGWIALGQSLTPLQVLGMVIALGGTVLGQLGDRAQKPNEPSLSPMLTDAPELAGPRQLSPGDTDSIGPEDPSAHISRVR